MDQVLRALDHMSISTKSDDLLEKFTNKYHSIHTLSEPLASKLIRSCLEAAVPRFFDVYGHKGVQNMSSAISDLTKTMHNVSSAISDLNINVKQLPSKSNEREEPHHFDCGLSSQQFPLSSEEELSSSETLPYLTALWLQSSVLTDITILSNNNK
ncbi:unnamed protein product [Schistosoma mattheei]|uniref:Uncharacterized protein n=1 Tax=Schistosoma mattheei TaxID=31246 RepID=A0AA85BPQ9_9TREM|nr:unnamed protein product [Schistosoma mattheei]